MPVLVTLAALVAALALGIRVFRLERAARLRSQARVAALSALIDPPVDGPIPVVFEKQESVLANGHLPLRVGLGAAVLLVLITLGLLLRTSHSAPQSPVAAAPSLELLSMEHQRNAETLMVKGRVRNQSQAAADRLTAVVAVFDKRGRAVASAAAPIDRQLLAPGDNSPFEVAIPHVTEVGRYRVSFQNDAGVVRHVDRRSGLAEQSATVASR